jgi:hypothetical protein
MGQAQGYATSCNRMKQLLIHADPGARSGFVAAWLLNKLDHAGFDVGASTKPPFYKIHNLTNVDLIKNHLGLKIRIKPTFEKLSLHLLLFLRKNAQIQIPDLTRDEFSIETFSKVYQFAKDCLDADKSLDYSLYDHIITFSDTFDIDCMTKLYHQYNGVAPTDLQIEQFNKVNKLNQINIDTNHACNIAAFILETEQRLTLKETDRFWSLPVVYETTDTDNLFSAIQANLRPENYNMPR